MEKQIQVSGTDDIRINPEDGSELKYWSHKFGVTKQDIHVAVDKVGDSLTAVTSYFRARR
ncbi:DUF3606 domain-containing protein [Pseudomonas sp. KU26590]|uniref:DUF3606 domain-containing protein n=1 Tax=Pseudomonas sp. KU26590 TaxID=2991051 RepID=UPI00223E5EC2|nr:DUF3606 domain-containing protein [Pseudomonas sp. KU26590]UZJ58055.1 DUF3606 domain-containing protein [Pseudomonas sp. KU26590]